VPCQIDPTGASTVGNPTSRHGTLTQRADLCRQGHQYQSPPLATGGVGALQVSGARCCYRGAMAASQGRRDPVRPAQERVVISKSGNACAYVGCGRELVVETTSPTDQPKAVGKVAHICAASPGGPRYDPLMTPEQRGSAANLIYMCGEHHDVIDSQISSHPAEALGHECEQVPTRLAHGNRPLPVGVPERVEDGVLEFVSIEARQSGRPRQATRQSGLPGTRRPVHHDYRPRLSGRHHRRVGDCLERGNRRFRRWSDGGRRAVAI